MKKRSLIVLIIPIIIVALIYGSMYLAAANDGTSIEEACVIFMLAGVFLAPIITLICSISGLIMAFKGKKNGEKTISMIVLGVIENVLSLIVIVLFIWSCL